MAIKTTDELNALEDSRQDPGQLTSVALLPTPQRLWRLVPAPAVSRPQQVIESDWVVPPWPCEFTDQYHYDAEPCDHACGRHCGSCMTNSIHD
jgi:hypothetical protein